MIILFNAKLPRSTIKKIVLTQRKALTFRKVHIFDAMNRDEIPGKEECANSLKNVLDALYVLNGRWKLPVVLSLIQMPKRFNEIQNAVSGISPKVLAKELKDLEENGFISRTVHPITPVTIIYEATEYSLTLKNVLHELGAWGKQHRERIKQTMRVNQKSNIPGF